MLARVREQERTDQVRERRTTGKASRRPRGQTLVGVKGHPCRNGSRPKWLEPAAALAEFRLGRRASRAETQTIGFEDLLAPDVELFESDSLRALTPPRHCNGYRDKSRDPAEECKRASEPSTGLARQ